jgi:hypothetical protein
MDWEKQRKPYDPDQDFTAYLSNLNSTRYSFASPLGATGVCQYFSLFSCRENLRRIPHPINPIACTKIHISEF